MRDSFSSYHPLVNFLFFGLVLVFSMIFMHPLCLAISLLAAFAYSVMLKGRQALRFNLRILLPLALLTALINPAFNHRGLTILAYFPNGNPLTLESILYGLAAAAMLSAVICWFSCYNVVITSDKFVYLFGRIIPALSLIFSMVLRFVPRFKDQFQIVAAAQKALGRDFSGRGLARKLRQGITILSIMITWSLENAIETADSMKSRGYGLPGRTAFSLYRWQRRDRNALLMLLLLGAYLIVGGLQGGLYWRYFPGFQGVAAQAFSVSLFSAYLLLCLTPLLINVFEERRWKLSQSSI